ncbi:MAG: tRNA (adenosine(37)-N6)-threonylcarbamoyltransferase complex dimerization subunit type 1 TsaB [Candidatus Fluviicola riflensis]|nr:MAG: tRNA (adenosine(37)-N6)-threonylcarbamoyltransferase complex dimerization subunit type 1 TsaB [Candidatus Fluviicola riflensis]OGS76876.1 MAG: tRNA (adenosine(37)-N6)-threonylcarbamoyltransferase complex dimerization subunit type 1 TsaB [Candidatus Fluviicola riflensis]OGS81806.1 MAG: tRNA (adenosine(37)-N6)-threonylcarbamoyltransferase complex dimerization subunit type 1 TsaB [Fluviicola sp. RIFCSPHIGHO2_01_FULL_43_53]OGS88605.1 MAG: tRNA (adenosine(37)-N6)-threonylcarbamoyltransferase 
MSWILHLETATKVCSVALSSNGELRQLEEIADDQYAHGEQLTLLIEKVLKNAAITPRDLAAVSVSSGPGSYTGLRIGVSTAKGLCYALGIPLIAIDSLSSMAALAHEKYLQQTLCPMIDARRMEVYCTIFATDGSVLKPMSADVLNENSYTDFEPFVFFGDGAPKMADLWKAKNAIFDSGLRCSASGQTTMAFEKFNKNEFEDVAYFEPLYLKEFVGTVKKQVE